MEPGGSMPHSQRLSNNPYPVPNHSPWAIINVKEQQDPQYVKVIKPPITIPKYSSYMVN